MHTPVEKSKRENHFLPLLAIDLLDGKVVRLSQGDYDRVTVYYSEPTRLIAELTVKKIQAFHLVDLNKARDPKNFSANQNAIQGITSYLAQQRQQKKQQAKDKSVTHVPKAPNVPKNSHLNFVQLGGGLRTMADLEHTFSLGVDRVILGTSGFTPLLKQAIQTFGSEAIAVALDVRSDQVMIHGWLESEKLTVPTALRYILDSGGTQVIFTDITRDGMLTGTGELAAETLSDTELEFFVSGGISCIQDIQHIKQRTRAKGVIIGRAYYEKKISVAEILDCMDTSPS